MSDRTSDQLIQYMQITSGAIDPVVTPTGIFVSRRMQPPAIVDFPATRWRPTGGMVAPLEPSLLADRIPFMTQWHARLSEPTLPRRPADTGYETPLSHEPSLYVPIPNQSWFNEWPDPVRAPRLVEPGRQMSPPDFWPTEVITADKWSVLPQFPVTRPYLVQLMPWTTTPDGWIGQVTAKAVYMDWFHHLSEPQLKAGRAADTWITARTEITVAIAPVPLMSQWYASLSLPVPPLRPVDTGWSPDPAQFNPVDYNLVSKWFMPLSTYPGARPLSIEGQTVAPREPSLVFVPSVASWYIEPPNPVLPRRPVDVGYYVSGFDSTALPLGPGVLSQWFAPLALPVPPRLPTQTGITVRTVDPTQVKVGQLDQWYRPFSTPVPPSRPVDVGTVAFTFDPTRVAAGMVSDWFAQLSTPVWVQPPRVPGLGLSVLTVDPTQVKVGQLDQWYAQLSRTIWGVPPRVPGLGLTVYTVDPTQAQAGLESQWFSPFSQPQMRATPAIAGGMVEPTEPVSGMGIGRIPRWYTALSQPAWGRTPVTPGWGCLGTEAVETGAGLVGEWFARLSEPVVTRPLAYTYPLPYSLPYTPSTLQAPSGNVWYGPAPGSTDLISMLTNTGQWPLTLKLTKYFLLSHWNFRANPPAWVGPNTWTALNAAGFVTFLNGHGIMPAFYTGVWKTQYCNDTNATQAISDAEEALDNLLNAGAPTVRVDIDEAFYAAAAFCNVTDVNVQAARIASFVNGLQAHQPGKVQVGITEPYPPTPAGPALSVAQIEAACAALIARNVKPAHFHLDVNWVWINQDPNGFRAIQLKNDLVALRNYFANQGIPWGVIYWPGAASETTNLDYCTAVLQWLAQVKAIIPLTDDLVFEDWVFSDVAQTLHTVPSNLPESVPNTYTWLIAQGIAMLNPPIIDWLSQPAQALPTWWQPLAVPVPPRRPVDMGLCVVAFDPVVAFAEGTLAQWYQRPLDPMLPKVPVYYAGWSVLPTETVSVLGQGKLDQWYKPWTGPVWDRPGRGGPWVPLGVQPTWVGAFPSAPVKELTFEAFAFGPSAVESVSIVSSGAVEAVQLSRS
jgi:hypothetical protein